MGKYDEVLNDLRAAIIRDFDFIEQGFDADNHDSTQKSAAIKALEQAERYGKLIEVAGKARWDPDGPKATILQRFDEATLELLGVCERFKNDWVWQERLASVEIARSLLAALPDGGKG